MGKEVCFELATGWDKFYTLEADAGNGCIVKEIKHMGSYYEVFFTDGLISSVHVHDVKYARFGNWQKIKEAMQKDKEPSTVLELVRGG